MFNEKCKVLLVRFADLSALLQMLTRLDLQIFTGFATLTLITCGWFTQLSDKPNPLGFMVIIIGLAFGAIRLLLANRKRRVEAITDLVHIKHALGFFEKGAYLDEWALEPEKCNANDLKKDIEEGKKKKLSVTFWAEYYSIGIVIVCIGAYLALYHG